MTGSSLLAAVLAKLSIMPSQTSLARRSKVWRLAAITFFPMTTQSFIDETL
jgi:hypothetical protein